MSESLDMNQIQFLSNEKELEKTKWHFLDKGFPRTIANKHLNSDQSRFSERPVGEIIIWCTLIWRQTAIALVTLVISSLVLTSGSVLCLIEVWGTSCAWNSLTRSFTTSKNETSTKGLESDTTKATSVAMLHLNMPAVSMCLFTRFWKPPHNSKMSAETSKSFVEQQLWGER